MRILADEDVERPVVERLRTDGHTVIAVSVESSGETDLPILARAVSENLLLTADLDFGEYIVRDQQPASIWQISLRPPARFTRPICRE